MKGKKTGGRDFVKGNKNTAGPGRPGLSTEEKALKKLTSSQFIQLVCKYFYMTRSELRATVSDDSISVLDWYIRNCIAKGIDRGDYGQLDSMLNRIIGKVKDKLEIDGSLDAEIESKTTLSDEAFESLARAIVKAKIDAK